MDLTAARKTKPMQQPRGLGETPGFVCRDIEINPLILALPEAEGKEQMKIKCCENELE